MTAGAAGAGPSAVAAGAGLAAVVVADLDEAAFVLPWSGRLRPAALCTRCWSRRISWADNGGGGGGGGAGASVGSALLKR